MAAGRSIKGITIELDGDTTNLTKALEGVNKSLKDTQSQLKDVNKLLKMDPTNTERLRQKHELLGKAVQETKEKLEKEQKAMEDLKKSGSTEENQRQQDALQREIIETTKKLEDLEKEYRESEPALAAFAARSAEVAEKTAAVSKVAAGAAAGLLANAYKAGQAADELNTLSKQTGLSVEELQRMQYASDLVDVSVDDMTGSLKKLTKQMGSGSKVFDQLGVSITDQNGNMRDATDVWYDSLQALSKIDNETERDVIAMELFGKSANDLAGIIDDGGEALRAYGDEAEDLGLVLSQDAVDAANEFNDAIDRLKARTSAAFFEAGAALADSLVPMLEKLVEKVTAVLQWFSDLDGETQTLILTILALVAAISPVAAIFSKVTSVVSGVSSAITFLSSPMGIAIVTIGALVAAGVALYNNWDTIKSKAHELYNTISQKFEAIKTKISTTIESARKAVSDGIEAIKKKFNFSWSLPKLKLPHISISGSFSLNPPGAPHFSISWYKKAMENGMILNSPTIFGMKNGHLLGAGEAGSETVVGTNSLMKMIQQASGAGRQMVINVYPSQGMDEEELAELVAEKINNAVAADREVFA